MVELIQIGPDNLDLEDWKTYGDNKNAELFDWIVYWYEGGYYDGDGMAAYKGGGKYGWKSLSHCSFYDPTDDLENPTMSLTNLLKDLHSTEKDYDHKYMSAVRNKVLELENNNE